ncbi:MAG: ATP-dependent DNA ligase [archaeon]|nr:MAG: ATP-dependent DNA ligase [archaeon]
MSDQLPNYVGENYAKAVKQDLGTWLVKNPLPALVERKYDGIRVFLFKSGEKLVLSSKHGGVYTPKGSPAVFSRVPEFLHAPHRMILDGEYLAREAKGLFLFDVLQVDDRDLREKPLRARKKVLREILKGTGLEVDYMQARTPEKILQLKDLAIKKGGEGVVVKNPESAYGQPGSWLKLKRFDTVDCFVVDFEETKEMRQTGVARSWWVGVYDDAGQVVDLGKVGSTFEKVDPRQVKKGSVVEIRFQELTRDKKLRAPYILRVRHDKTPEECLMSQFA